jgi:hypothetical protein
MNDPQRRPADHPRRAAPLRPDKPGSGLHSQSEDDGTAKRESLRKTQEQEGTAVDNARKGYD